MSSEFLKYRDIWQSPNYRIRSHSLELWESHRHLFPSYFESALDIGCGLGRLMRRLNGQEIDAWGIDITSNCLESKAWQEKFIEMNLWEMDLGRKFDLGICTDVMEHIPPEHVKEVLRRIFKHCDTTIFSIANSLSHWLGYDLHLTVKPLDWWIETFESVGPAPEVLTVNNPRQNVYHLRWK